MPPERWSFIKAKIPTCNPGGHASPKGGVMSWIAWSEWALRLDSLVTIICKAKEFTSSFFSAVKGSPKSCFRVLHDPSCPWKANLYLDCNLDNDLWMICFCFSKFSTFSLALLWALFGPPTWISNLPFLFQLLNPLAVKLSPRVLHYEA